MGTVSATYLQSYYNTCVDKGCPSSPLLEQIGHGLEPFENPAARFDNETVLAMLHLAERLTGDTRMGLYAGMGFRPATFLDTSLVSCATLRDALNFNGKYQRLTQELGKTHLDVSAGEARIIWRPFTEDAEYMRPITEAVFAGYAAFGRWLTWLHNQEMVAMRFRHKETQHAEYTSDLFGCSTEYKAPVDMMIFDVSLIDMPLPQSNPTLIDILSKRLDQQLAELDAPVTTRAQTYQCIQSMLDVGAPNTARVAAALSVSERTLRRRLADEGMSFRSILENVRRDLCEVFIREHRKSIAEIAQALGYSEQSAFTRAFKKWYGKPPSKYIRGF